MLKPSRTPYGFRNLLAYRKAEELQKECSRLTAHFPHSKTLSSLSDQMNRSARSAKQNIVEGWKRNSTCEYYEFLGYAVASNTELEEDCDDIIRGVYPELMGIKGVMRTPSTLSSHFSPSAPFSLSEVEKLPFYPLNPHLPPVIQLKLRSKELNYLLHRLQKSLETKMGKENTMTANDKFNLIKSEEDRQKKFEKDLQKIYNLKSPED